MNKFTSAKNWLTQRVFKRIPTPFDDFHVTPVNDLKEHDISSMDCWCNPKVNNDFPPYFIIHNSLDRRELKEAMNDLKNLPRS